MSFGLFPFFVIFWLYYYKQPCISILVPMWRILKTDISRKNVRIGISLLLSPNQFLMLLRQFVHLPAVYRILFATCPLQLFYGLINFWYCQDFNFCQIGGYQCVLILVLNCISWVSVDIECSVMYLFIIWFPHFMNYLFKTSPHIFK